MVNIIFFCSVRENRAVFFIRDLGFTDFFGILWAFDQRPSKQAEQTDAIAFRMGLLSIMPIIYLLVLQPQVEGAEFFFIFFSVNLGFGGKCTMV